LRFLIDTSNGKEEPKMKENVSRRKEVIEEEAGSGDSSTDSVNSGSGTDYQICIPLGWALWCG
jgi:hypothetical protein